MVTNLRLLTQHVMFLVLTYGGRFGISLGNSPALFQLSIRVRLRRHLLSDGLAGQLVGAANVMGQSDECHGSAVALLSGNLHPAGHRSEQILVRLDLPLWHFAGLADLVTTLGGIREAQFSWLTKNRLKVIKWILLAYTLLVPLLIAHVGWHYDLHLPFCRSICPAKPLMPLFVGNTRHLAIDVTNTVTLVFSILSVGIAAGMLVGMFFKERFFCLFCPMLPLIHIFRKISPIRFEKNVAGCTGCGIVTACVPWISGMFMNKRKTKTSSARIVCSA